MSAAREGRHARVSGESTRCRAVPLVIGVALVVFATAFAVAARQDSPPRHTVAAPTPKEFERFRAERIPVASAVPGDPGGLLVDQSETAMDETYEYGRLTSCAPCAPGHRVGVTTRGLHAGDDGQFDLTGFKFRRTGGLSWWGRYLYRAQYQQGMFCFWGNCAWDVTYTQDNDTSYWFGVATQNGRAHYLDGCGYGCYPGRQGGGRHGYQNFYFNAGGDGLRGVWDRDSWVFGGSIYFFGVQSAEACSWGWLIIKGDDTWYWDAGGEDAATCKYF